MDRFLLVLRVQLLLSSCTLTLSVDTSSFVNFGPHAGDSALAPNDDGWTQLVLRSPFPFYGADQSTLFFDTNGLLSFQ